MSEIRTYIDFAEIKRRISLHQCVTMLGLDMKRSANQFRSSCPVHGGGDRTLVVTPDKGFYCFGDRKGGDQIALVAHVKQINNREAAEAICLYFSLDLLPEPKERPAQAAKPPAPPKAEPDGRREGMEPLDYLEPSHPVADMLGLSAATLEALGGGYAPRGTMAGRLLLPLRLSDGTLTGYLGIATKTDQEPLLLFPDNLEERCTAKPAEQEKPASGPDELRKLFRVVA